MRRLFFALWPNQQTRNQIAVVSDLIQQEGIRKLLPSNLHTTLVFMGNIDDDIAETLIDFADQIVLPAFEIRFDTLEYWQKPKVLCLTASQQPQAIHDLVDELTAKVRQFPIFLEQRPYRAHITLARKAKSPYEMDIDPIHWQAESFALIESISTDSGVKYQVVKSWPLAQ